MDELYMENIDEMVTDHNKIVTYKLLSHTLGVHVNQSKQMLYDYVTRKRKENQSAQVHVTYLVTGKCSLDGYTYHKVAVVKEEKLEAVKSTLELVASVHVYSVQKAALKDSAPLFNTDYDIVKNNLQNCNKFSAIQCPAAVPRSPEEIAHLQRLHGQPTEDVAPSSTPTLSGQASQPVTKATAQRPKGIMGMFSRPPSKSQEPKKESKEEAPPETSSKPSAKSRMANNFFGKASFNKPKESVPVGESIKQEKPAAQPIDVSPPAPKVAEATSAPENKSKIKRTELENSDEEDMTLVKKRRRIKQPRPDSSDEDEAAPDFQDVKTPPPPPESVVKVETETQPQTQPVEKRRKRRRVLKSKTFMEDGCMVTEKVYESESCTDSGEEFKTARATAANHSTAAKPHDKAETKAAKKAPAASKGTKQASIMGFFQKK